MSKSEKALRSEYGYKTQRESMDQSTYKQYCDEGNFVIAAMNGNLSECMLMLEQGIYINANNDCGTALTRAAKNGRLEVCKFLLKNGANANIPDIEYDGWTALMMAAEHGHVEVCKLLIQYGADTNIATYSGLTFTTCCKNIFSTKIVSLLREHGIINLESKEISSIDLVHSDQITTIHDDSIPLTGESNNQENSSSIWSPCTIV
jgi:ankyrin repeat protein